MEDEKSGEREQLKECRLGVTPGGQQQTVVGEQEEEWEGERAAPFLFQPKDSQLCSTDSAARRSPTHLT